jgi:vacuolar protein sorting-associated protein 1
LSIPACFADVITFSGVITKTDALDDGAVNLRARWGRIFTGEESAHRFRHGYFAVRLADDNQRTAGVSREEMKQISDRFFASTAPWRDMDPAYRERLGITNLTEYLSKLLIELIEARFFIQLFFCLKLLMRSFLFPC